ncbi:MAG: hypothetical protein LKH59_05240 [Lactobacillus crispatus]|jgi:gas vesicle protein|uniref:hypothetical protein n=1 Tax=Lactobacillus crispatus TaxID=47770 RepID=UPI0018A8E72D|nr:hypothetical protein [Lactobacillus crispatus]MCH4004140.1 hypothetical protein [Lactobacillus crispatus]MCI1335829.1 hypothetical protein [Lactobacillus crispatus]MCI1365222.1 hypothetical protein [Lactobacillus crispatus]MCI1493803.1 hypothetical protein [Lactobacillus crispatus]MCI1524503.1 hypothetical protein [Lactobacillus crispatus]
MKHFLLGTVFGAAAGLVFSCMKDSNGNRPGKPLKDEFDAIKHEGQRFNAALQKARKASAELNAQMPEAERTVSDISDSVEHYSEHIQPIVNRMEKKSDELNQDLENIVPNNASEESKD